MSVKFDISNLASLLIVLWHEQKHGPVIPYLLAEIDNAVAAYNAEKNQQVKGISRATLFKYLAEFDRAFPNGGDADPSDCAQAFVKSHPKTARKFFRQFNSVTFEALFRFLDENDYLGDKLSAREAIQQSDGLYFALADFLGDRVAPAADRQKLPGHYVVYRPSLTEPGKVLVSCARISVGANGAIRYREKMHFKGSLGWRVQLFEGFCASRERSYFLLTKDSGTGLMQSSVLHVLHESKGKHDDSIISMMAGSYSGATGNRPTRLFHTGIFLQRRAFGKLERHDLFRWKFGLMRGFGLLDPLGIPDLIRRHMNGSHLEH